jgi:hypothetical protein
MTGGEPRSVTPGVLTSVGTDTAVVVPLRPGRKHLLPDARWDTATVDDAQLIWTSVDAHRLAVMRRLRAHGFSESMLCDDSPAYLAGLPPTSGRRSSATGTTSLVASGAAWFEIGLRATRP